MKRLSLVLCLAFGSIIAGAEPDTSFLRKYAETRGFMLGRPVKPKLTPDGKHVLFLRAEGPTTPKHSLFEFDVENQTTRELLSAETLLKGAEEALSPEEKARRERQRVTVGGFAAYHLNPDGKRLMVMLSGRIYLFDRATAKVRELPTGEGTIIDPKWSPDGKRVSYVRDHDVYVFDPTTNKEQAVTTGGTEAVTHGLAEFVAQEEMDRDSGYWWSPDSRFIAFEEADHREVEVWFIADPSRPDREPHRQFYPRPGRKNVSVRLGIAPIAGGKIVWVNWDRAKWEYLASVNWDKHGALTIQLQDRAQQKLALMKVDTDTGMTSTLLTEEDSTWVNLSQDVPKWLGDHRFLWLTDDDGDTRLQLIDTQLSIGKQSRYVSPPDLQITGLSKPIVTRSSGEVMTLLVQGTTNAVTNYPWMIMMNRSSALQLEKKFGDGIVTMNATDDLSGSVATFTSISQMPTTTVATESLKQGIRKTTLPSIAEEPAFKPSVRIQQFGEYWTAVVRPRHFDPKKKYPVIVDVYGGPLHSHVQHAMRNWLVPQWLADQGFIVVAIDNHGTPGRGRAWERAMYQKFGTVPLEDQVKCLKLLGEKFPELDSTRVGIIGWSFGGYMAANAVLRRPDFFQAAVAGAPVTDWLDYDTHYTERYLGLLPASKRAYDDASLLPLAKELKRPLLLVHGTADDNVYFRHSLKLADALFRAGKDFEMLPLAGITHQYTADPAVMERYWSKAARFFQKHLGEPK